MSLRLYDTRARRLRVFEPLRPGQASVYVCGPTVQAPPHIGHVRSAVVFDVLRRWLIASGYRVTFVRNVTDIDDKILREAALAGEPWWALAERIARGFAAAYDALNVLPPTLEPRATGHVPAMIRLMRHLVERGHAYAAGGDVYFAVRTFPAYGSLSGQRVDALDTLEEPGAKRDPIDFALWKGAKPGEPAWETPWGEGRPGWHLECSAMATEYLGSAFDIHGGGLDLVFPHHENEIAQSEAAGDGFARYWLHHALVRVGAEKMSKSLGNSLLVGELLTRVRPAALRYYLAAPHYRSPLEWSEQGVAEAAAAYARVENFLTRAQEIVGQVPEPGVDAAVVPSAFAAAMDDDLGVPQALAVVHARVRDGNEALLAGDKDATADALADVRAMVGVLGLDPADFARADAGGDLVPVVEALVRVALEQRQAARARLDFGVADAIRDALSAAGITVEDTPSGPRWALRRG
ncbi:MAG: cysteine--tRNA ligase [Mycobacterium leprae]